MQFTFISHSIIYAILMFKKLKNRLKCPPLRVTNAKKKLLTNISKLTFIELNVKNRFRKNRDRFVRNISQN